MSPRVHQFPPPDGYVRDGANEVPIALVDGASPSVENAQVTYHQTPSLSSGAHFGSRLVFGRDGTLFVTQGAISLLTDSPAGRLLKLVVRK